MHFYLFFSGTDCWTTLPCVSCSWALREKSFEHVDRASNHDDCEFAEVLKSALWLKQIWFCSVSLFSHVTGLSLSYDDKSSNQQPRITRKSPTHQQGDHQIAHD